MPRNIFVDTGVFIALADKSDQYNLKAKAQAKEVERQKAKLYTTDLVVAETHSYLHYHLGIQAARTFWRKIMDGSSGVQILFTTSEDLASAWGVVDRYPDQDFSLIDCVSFAVIERMGLHEAFTFDARHYDVYRLKTGAIIRIPQ